MEKRLSEKESEFISHEPCDKCGSSDAFATYSDGHGYCFSCSHYVPAEGDNVVSIKRESKVSKEFVEGEPKAIPKRGLKESTCKFWNYMVANDKGQPCQVANYVKDGVLVAQKIRYAGKKFRFAVDKK